MDPKNKIATRQSYGEALKELGKEKKEIVVLDADLASATKTNIFAAEFSERFFDMGIAEQNMIGTAAGMATCGFIPYASTFAVFAAGRTYDQIRASVCYPNINVKIVATHSGVTVGEDGATHQMLEDLGLMRGLPNMQVFCPSDDTQTRWLIKEISNIKGPCYVRLARLATPVIYDEEQKFEIGKGIQIGEGRDAAIIATGDVVYQAILAKEELEKENINVRVIDIHTIKPIDKELIIKAAKETKKIITIEDHSIINGLGSSVCEVLAENNPSKVVRMGVKDVFGKSGNGEKLLEYFHLTSKDIIQQVKGE